MESLEFMVSQFLWYSWVALPNEFTSLTKTNQKELLKLKTDASAKLHPHKYAKNPQHENLNDSTVLVCEYRSIEQKMNYRSLE